MVWYTLGIFSEGGASASAVGAMDTASEELLYESSVSVPETISIGGIHLDEGLATLEVQSHRTGAKAWRLTMHDAEGEELYAVSPYSASAVMNESLVLSLIYDERGLFISSSPDATVMGPYEYKGPLALDIVRESGDSLEDIQAVRLFRD
jgi:hypothetical protein